MIYKCIACKEIGFDTFYKKEKALNYLLTLDNEQKDVFIYHFNNEYISNIIDYYKETQFEFIDNQIYYKDYYIKIDMYSVETNHIEYNLLFEYLKRIHRIWCCIDEENNIIWINACKFV